tara:strand:+ start:1590 stop:3314 length:1725 start_codon:yes stop_codon:yes gene_type:complete
METEGNRRFTALLLHPVTQDVYRVPASAIEHDCNRPVRIDFDAFEDMASLGCMSAERFLNAARHSVNIVGFNVSQVLAVRLKNREASANGRPMYAWASRMSTVSPMEGIERTSERTMGHEFIWMWPPGKAWNAWITRKEQQRIAGAEQSVGIDACEPSVRYVTKQPGLMLGPDDVEGCVRVPPEELTVMQRLFVACIKPQQTLFARRTLAQDWTDRIERVTDENQESFCDTADEIISTRRLLLESKYRDQIEERMGLGKTKRTCDDDMLRPNVALPLRKRQRWVSEKEPEFRNWYKTNQMFRPHGSSIRSALVKNGDAHIWHELKHLIDFANDMRDQWLSSFSMARWASLPDDLLVNILCTRLGQDLNGSTEQAAQSICTMRLVSKAARAITDRFVGAQLAKIETAFHYRIVSPTKVIDSKAPSGLERMSSIGSLGRSLRRVGLGVGDMIRLTNGPRMIVPKVTEKETGMVPSSLPSCPKNVPDWRTYLHLRQAREVLLGGCPKVRVPRTAPSVEFARVYQSLREGDPGVNGTHYAAAGSGRANMPNPAFDPMLCAEHGDADQEAQTLLASAGL